MNITLRIPILITLLIFCIAISATAQWEYIGESNSESFKIAGNEQYLFACTGNGLYRANELNYWEKLENGIPRYLDCHNISINGKNVLVKGYHPVLDKCALYYSNDNGSVFEEIPIPKKA